MDAQYQEFCAEIDKKKGITVAEKAKQKREKYRKLQEQLDPYSDPDASTGNKMRSRIWKLSNLSIYGTDANDRMARTSKMNMIMHGDGHGGVHHHNGLLNVNGIFEGRFNVIATNPPFGASVTAENVILASDYHVPAEARSRYRSEYGELYDQAVGRIEANLGKPILDLFQLPRSKSMKTELVFIERCLDLLAPGGRMGIVLPEGIFNNPSLAYVREFTEDRAFLRAVVSLSQDAFVSSGASVKCSVLFLEKFTEKEAGRFAKIRAKAISETTAKHKPTIDAEVKRIEEETVNAMMQGEKTKAADLRKELKAFDKRMADTIATESRALLKKNFDYPVFLYEAEKVGISATGEAGPNELYPNDRLPPDVEKSCLELYREFRKDPEPFFVNGPAA